MLAKKYRLQIQHTLKLRASVKKSSGFTLKTFTSTLPYGRFGVSISKQVAPKATQRNRIKRAIFEAARPLVVGRPGVDTLIIVHKDAMIEELKKLL